MKNLVETADDNCLKCGFPILLPTWASTPPHHHDGCAEMNERQFTYVGGRKMDITGLSVKQSMAPYLFVSFEVWNSRSHGILCRPGSHNASTHYIGDKRMGYTCEDCMWICPIQEW